MGKSDFSASGVTIASQHVVVDHPPTTAPVNLQPVDDVAKILEGARAFEKVTVIPATTYKDNSTVILIPTRGSIDTRVTQSLMGLLSPMNQKRWLHFIRGAEVGQAYTDTIQGILANPELSKWKYVLTLEDDNIQPPDAHIRLLETIEAGPYDAVSGIYFTKGEWSMPMAYGDPEVYKTTGVLDFRPRDIREALAKGHVLPVNGIAMGCALWRMDLFREIAAPWFVTVSDVIPDKGPACFTQDLYFCERAVRQGKTFAVDMRVRVGHLDVNTGIVY